MRTGFRTLKLVSALVVVSASTFSFAQQWPTRPIKLVVPYPPGGGTDAVLRVIVPKISASLGQPIVIENKGGANTIIGTDAVAKSAADGYTFGVITDSHSINPNFQKLPYDSVQSFQPVSQLVFIPFALITKSGSEINSVAKLVSMAKARPGRLSYRLLVKAVRTIWPWSGFVR
ncbi:MAG: tripartite tricarboxylate transporter substrate binding protein [Polaromonas sp.]|jgi:tripartite-type tricarboxylate transporter receptor subunit TctC|nr:tripartite tricarboxylate transporter substrate binding protein [Polaromonas sp.]